MLQLLLRETVIVIVLQLPILILLLGLNELSILHVTVRHNGDFNFTVPASGILFRA